MGLTCVLFPNIIGVVHGLGHFISNFSPYNHIMFLHNFAYLYYLFLLYNILTFVLYSDIIGVVHGVSPVKTHYDAKKLPTTFTLTDEE